MIGRVGRRAALVVTVVAATVAGLSAHVPVQPPGSLRAGMQVSLNIGGQPFSIRGTGECTQSDSAAQGARVFSARRRDSQRDLEFTLWRGASAPDQFLFVLRVDGREYRVQTARAAGTAAGSGQATLQMTGKGGVLNIYALTAAGVRVSGQVSCSAFWRV